MNAERDDDEIVVVAPLAYKDRCREVAGARHVRGVWRYPLSWAHCIMLRGVFGDELAVGPELRAWAVTEKQRVARAMALREEGGEHGGT